MERNIRQFLNNSQSSNLIEGISLDKLKQKYQPNRIELDLTQAIHENQDLFANLNQAAQ